MLTPTVTALDPLPSAHPAALATRMIPATFAVAAERVVRPRPDLRKAPA